MGIAPSAPGEDTQWAWRFHLGWPDWVFWGIVVPWGACVVVSALFAFVFMQDAPLGEDRDDEEELL